MRQLDLAVAIGVSVAQIGIWERGRKPSYHGLPAGPPSWSRDRLETLARELGCTVEAIADRAALSANTRLLLGMEPLGPARAVIGGVEYDLTDGEIAQAQAFFAGLMAARELS